MSFTALAWASLAVSFSVLSVQRAVWAVALYLLTFFAAPHLWWWGRDLPSLRYSLMAGLFLALAVFLHHSGSAGSATRRYSKVHVAAVAMIVNATFVHLLLATDPVTSGHEYVEFLKYTLLFFLIWAAIQDRRDFRLVFVAIALGAGYIGYEVTINGRGDFIASRLEGVGAPGADNSNSLACLMLTMLPLIGSLFLGGSKREKLVVLLSAPLVLNVLLMCNSRGAFLGLIAAGLSVFLVARGATRKKAIRVLALSSLALYFLLGNPRIVERFVTTFVDSEQRDNAAASRLEFWQAGFRMLQDYPFGAGGNAFKMVHGSQYLTEVTGTPDDRSLHSGYLTEATSWGVQGLALKLVFLLGAVMAAYRTTVRCRREGRTDDAIVGVCVVAAAIGFLVHSFFGAFFNNEWSYWLTAFLVRYHELYQAAEQPSREVVQAAAPQAA